MKTKFLFFSLILISISNLGNATTPCIAGYNVLGFSVDWQLAYWETRIGGECSEALVLNQYDFSTNKIKKIFWTYLDGEEFEGEDKELRKFQYDTQKSNLKKKLRSVSSGSVQDVQGKTLATITLGCKNKIKPLDERSCEIMLKRGKKECLISNIKFEDKERYLLNIVKPTQGYFNPKIKQWIIQREHCSLAQSPCYIDELKEWNTAPSIAVYQDCTK